MVQGATSTEVWRYDLDGAELVYLAVDELTTTNVLATPSGGLRLAGTDPRHQPGVLVVQTQ